MHGLVIGTVHGGWAGAGALKRTPESMNLQSGLNIGVQTEKVRRVVLVLYLNQARMICPIGGIDLCLRFVRQIIGVKTICVMLPGLVCLAVVCNVRRRILPRSPANERQYAVLFIAVDKSGGFRRNAANGATTVGENHPRGPIRIRFKLTEYVTEDIAVQGMHKSGSHVRAIGPWVVEIA